MGFNREDVERLSAALSEPDWVLERRLQAWKIFEDGELPGEKEEPWRYTDLRRMKFSLDSFTASFPEGKDVGAAQEALVEQEGERGGYLIQRDADVVHCDLNAGVAQDGVVLSSLGDAIMNHPEIVQEHLFRQTDPQEHIFAALQASLFTGGTFLYVPDGVTVAVPIESQHWMDDAASAMFPHTLVVVGKGAELVYFERLRSSQLGEPSIYNGATEIVAGAGSRVGYVCLQEFDESIWNFQRILTQTGKDATFRSLVVAFGSRFSRTEVKTTMLGEHADVTMNGLYFAEQGQHFDFRTLQDHAAPFCTSNLLYKGALKDKSRTVYAGLIRVQEAAAKTDAYQTNRNLVLSDHAKADSKPELEILNNDVKCSHGASVGQIREDEVFYLMARGIPRPEAERLIINGFFEEVIGAVTQEEVRSVLSGAIERKLA